MWPDGGAKRAEIHRHDGGRLVYYHWPADGPSLLFIPGSWSEYRQFDAVRAHLDQDVNLVIVELPGHGRSWPPTIEGSIEGFAKDVLRVTDALGWKLWYAGGHSIGGMIAIELAGQRPEQVAGVISIEGWTHHHVSREAFSGHNYNTLSETQEEATATRALQDFVPTQQRADRRIRRHLAALGWPAHSAVNLRTGAGNVG